jgi:hypothetical protein
VQSEVLILLRWYEKYGQIERSEKNNHLLPTRSGLAATAWHETASIRATLSTIGRGGKLVVAAAISVIWTL